MPSMRIPERSALERHTDERRRAEQRQHADDVPPFPMKPPQQASSLRQRQSSQAPRQGSSEDRARSKDAASRETPADTGSQGGLPLTWLPQQNGQGGGTGGEDSDDRENGGAAGAATGTELTVSLADDAELSMLADQLSIESGADHMFEVTMPHGETVGVYVVTQSDKVSFMLNTQDDRLSKQLRLQRSSLEDAVGRRIQRSVRITVL